MQALPTREQMRQMTSDELFNLFRQLETLSAQTLACCADLYAEMQERGIDTSGIHDSVTMQWVRKIAGGKVLAETVHKFGQKIDILKQVSKLSPKDQERLIQDSRVEVVERDPTTNELTTRKLPVENLGLNQRKLVFTNSGEIRTPDQQRALLADHLSVPVTPFTTKARVVIVRGKLRTYGDVPVAEVIDLLREKGFLPPVAREVG